jgi:energy-coupling factor transport system ATP-binding protein
VTSRRSSDHALEVRAVTFVHHGAVHAALQDVDLVVPAGEILLVAGPSGSGKSTLLRTVNGLVPHSSGGRFGGEVLVHGRSTRLYRPRDLADVVGFVHQDPEAQTVVDQVEADVAFSLENLGLDATAMRRRVEEVLDALGIAALRHRSPSTLSGGERQRLAIAGALAAAPAVLVLDEPTSQLDPQGADDVLAALGRLNADLGATILLSEHRLERAAPLADRAVLLDGGRIVADGDPPEVVAGYAGAPTVTHLGRLLGWDPLPLTVRDARRRAAGHEPLDGTTGPTFRRAAAGAVLRSAAGIDVSFSGHRVIHGVDLDVREGEVVALLGRNGAGKTTVLRALAGLVPVDRGVLHGDAAVAYVPQDPNSLLFRPTVRREVATTLQLLGRPDRGEVDAWLERLALTALADRHPRSLSTGERQRVAIAAVAVGGAPVLLLDEPTRGMDAPSKEALERAVVAHAAAGGACVLATHDVELAARCATRAVVLGDGEVVASGEAREVLAGSLFAPQVLRVLPPFLTVREVALAMDAASGGAP